MSPFPAVAGSPVFVGGPYYPGYTGSPELEALNCSLRTKEEGP